MNGFAVLLRKELLESVRTLRLPIVAGLFLVLGILSPVTARYLREIVQAFAPADIGVVIPPPTASDALDQLQKNIGQFGALAAVLLTMGSVAVEKERGTAAFVLVKPVARAAFLAAKVVDLGIVLGVATVLAIGAGWAYTVILFGPQQIGGWIVLGVLLWLSTGAYAAVTFVGSTLTRSSLAAAGIGFGGLIVLALLSTVPQIGRYLPAGLVTLGKAVALGRTAAGTDALGPIVAVTALIVTALAAAWLSFRRQEL
ncbi:MAG: type transport system permease protein [Chloroflexota bacterium]|nr:type transport system permease protein [Chloroflexota bacterium]